MYQDIMIAVIIGYLLGSIPFALVIGKLFFKTDVREHGSGNLGGSNAGRILGSKVGATVIILDVLKVTFAIFITSHFKYSEMASIWAGLAAAFGHCYPVFAGFKGGKAVATMFGFLLGISIFTFQDANMLLVPLVAFLIVLLAGKMVSLASIVAAITSSIYIFIDSPADSTRIASILLTILLIYRHRSNIQRILKGEENKVGWLSKKK
ncbi:MAG: glycerol-3-phosphate 1-O-acyltransferase [Erysipelotrichia bacterium]|nr:glycerol-3-phosphate 1-O-acyltransferase [Erysipelotrichia bacterium]NCC54419.1 glycerol-3-phosphate 1-O-acyltransferase [Erysipelotrichia bacterium]